MKLAKALKEKNRLAGEIARLKTLIQRENSRNTKSTSKIDVGQLWIELDAATEKLIALKTEIFKANAGIYDRIVRMAELKGKALWLTGLNTRNETVEQPYGVGTILTTEFKAHFKQEDIDRMTKELQDGIAKLQDELDEYNATVNIQV
jgi:hypothetical protein